MQISNNPINYNASQVNGYENKRYLYFVHSDSHLSLDQQRDYRERMESFSENGILRANKILNKFQVNEVNFAPLSSVDRSFNPFVCVNEVDMRGLDLFEQALAVAGLVNDGTVGFINMTIERHSMAVFKTRKEFVEEINQRLLCGLVFITSAQEYSEETHIYKDIFDPRFAATKGIRELRLKADIKSDNIIGILVPDPLLKTAQTTFPHLGKYIIGVPIEKVNLTLADFTFMSSVRCLEDENNPVVVADVPDYSRALQNWLEIGPESTFYTHLTRIATTTQLSMDKSALIDKPKIESINPNFCMGNEWSKKSPLQPPGPAKPLYFSIPRSGDYQNRFAVETELAQELAKKGKVHLIGKSFSIKDSPELIFVKTASANFSSIKSGGFREEANVDRKGYKDLSPDQISHILMYEPLVTIEQGLNANKEKTFILTYPKFLSDRVAKICTDWHTFKQEDSKYSVDESLEIRAKVLAGAADKYINHQKNKIKDKIIQETQKPDVDFDKVKTYAETGSRFTKKFHL